MSRSSSLHITLYSGFLARHIRFLGITCQIYHKMKKLNKRFLGEKSPLAVGSLANFSGTRKHPNKMLAVLYPENPGLIWRLLTTSLRDSVILQRLSCH